MTMGPLPMIRIVWMSSRRGMKGAGLGVGLAGVPIGSAQTIRV
jgi:hypothetical protein